MSTNGSNNQVLIPIFKDEKYHLWSHKMKTMFWSQELWTHQSMQPWPSVPILITLVSNWVIATSRQSKTWWAEEWETTVSHPFQKWLVHALAFREMGNHNFTSFLRMMNIIPGGAYHSLRIFDTLLNVDQVGCTSPILSYVRWVK